MEKSKQRDVMKQTEKETGSGAELRREWLLEVGHRGTDVIQSDVQGGGWTRATVCVTFCPAHTLKYTHALTLRYISSVHWVNNTCAEVKIAYLCIVL